MTAAGLPVRFKNRKILQLAALMALRPGFEHDRNWLARTIWPEAEHEQLLANLRNALAVLRKDLESAGLEADKVLKSDKTSASLSSEHVTSDCAQATALVQASKSTADIALRLRLVSQAFTLLSDPFAPQLNSDWATTERFQFDNLKLNCAQETVVLAQKSSCSADYADTIVEMSKKDIENEAKTRLALQILIDAARPGEAVKHYRHFERCLREKLALRPSAQTVALARRARELSASVSELPPSNIPIVAGAFFGREGDLELLASMLRPVGERPKIVTIIGPGGVGKTRTALEAVERARTLFRDAIYFVELASLDSPDEILPKTVEVLSGQFDTTTTLETLRQTLSRPSLVVMDNLEQMGPGVGSVFTKLLQTCPELQILATSRHSIGAPGEVSVRLGPLAVPELPSEALESPCVQLYIDRAKATAPTFVPGDSGVLAELARRLEGLPLAICLAASKADVLTPEQTLKELTDRFEVLQTQDLDWPERHRKLWACIDWSYRLVPEAHSVLKQLATFKGGWTTQLAEWTIPFEGVKSALQTLLRSSLVFESSRGTQIRFDMVQSVKEFVQQLMTEPEREQAMLNHASGVRSWIRDSQAKGQAFTTGYIAERSAEYENFKSAFEWALQIDPVLSLEIANALSYYWWSREMCHEGIQWLESAVKSVPSDPSEPLAMAYRALSTLRIGISEFSSAIEALEIGFSLLPDEIEPLQRARYLNSMGNALIRMGRFDDAIAQYDSALDLCNSVGDHQIDATLIGNKGFTHYLAGNLERAEEEIKTAIGQLSPEQNDVWLGSFWHNFGLVARTRGDLVVAEERFAEARRIFERSGGDPVARSWLTDSAVVALRLGKVDEGLEMIKKSAAGIAPVKGEEQSAECLDAAAEYCEIVGDYEEAVALLTVVTRAKDPPQRSLADKSPTVASRLEVLKSKLEWARYRTAEARYAGLTLRDVLEELADLPRATS